MAKETNIDCRKYRKSTHLAAADLDAMYVEGKPLIFTIKEVWYDTKVDVSGEKTDGYFCSFKEPIKDMVINSTNRKVIAGFARKKGFNEIDCWNIGNWNGIRIEFFVLRDIKAFGKVQDGIRIKPMQPEEKKKPIFSEANFEKANIANANIETIEKAYQLTEEVKQQYLKYVSDNSLTS